MFKVVHLFVTRSLVLMT